jgi:16S rRNA (guanine527-N7)-methyltransferase
MLLAYLGLMQRWNKRFNLTAVRDESEMVTRHLLDSLSVHPHLSGEAIIDVGSGAGLPGIPLAIVNPRRRFTLLDSNGKKTRFMFQAISELGLGNCTVVQARVETWQSSESFDTVLSRAFASLGDMIDTCRHLLKSQGRLFAMKGMLPEAELAAVESIAELDSVTTLSVPGLDEARCLVVLRPQTT